MGLLSMKGVVGAAARIGPTGAGMGTPRLRRRGIAPPSRLGLSGRGELIPVPGTSGDAAVAAATTSAGIPHAATSQRAEAARGGGGSPSPSASRRCSGGRRRTTTSAAAAGPSMNAKPPATCLAGVAIPSGETEHRGERPAQPEGQRHVADGDGVHRAGQASRERARPVTLTAPQHRLHGRPGRRRAGHHGLDGHRLDGDPLDGRELADEGVEAGDDGEPGGDGEEGEHGRPTTSTPTAPSWRRKASRPTTSRPTSYAQGQAHGDGAEEPRRKAIEVDAFVTKVAAGDSLGRWREALPVDQRRVRDELRIIQVDEAAVRRWAARAPAGESDDRSASAHLAHRAGSGILDPDRAPPPRESSVMEADARPL